MKSENVDEEDERIWSPYGDLWFVRSKDGTTLVPMYSDRLCALAAAEAFVNGNFGALTVEEIEFFKSLKKEDQVESPSPRKE